jgi:conjugative relaxase-like TrwC/TraI family protein
MFSPPTSVSIAGLVGSDQRIVAAHNNAVKVALKELEQFAAARVPSNKQHRRGCVSARRFTRT